MLEVINGFLLVYFVALCTISALVPQLVKPVSIKFTIKNKYNMIFTRDHFIKLNLHFRLQHASLDHPMRSEQFGLKL